MSFTPNDSAIRLSPEDEKKIQSMSTEQIKAYMISLAEQQSLITRDQYDPNITYATPLADAAPKKFGKVLMINGEKHVLEADSPENLARAEADFYQEIFGKKSDSNTNSATEQPRDAASGRFVSPQQQQSADAQRAAALTDLELRFKRGEISASDYIRQSGAVDEYLASQGVSMDTLKSVVEQKAGETYVKSWQDSVSAFRQSHPEWNAYASDENTKIIGQILETNNLADAPDKTEALEAALNFALEHKLLTKTPEAALSERISGITDKYELQRVLQPNGSLFGR